MRRLLILLIGTSSLCFADNRFYNDDEITDNIFIETYRVLNQIRDQNQEVINSLKEIKETVKSICYGKDLVVDGAHEAVSK